MLRLCSLIGLCAGLLFVFTPAAAGTFNVPCDDTPALVAAVATANSNNQDDVFEFPPGCGFLLTSPLEIGADGGHSLSLIFDEQGWINPAYDTYIPLLKIAPGADLTMRNGSLSSGYNQYGGLIYNEGTLNLHNGGFGGSNAEIGGAIYSKGGAVTISDSSFWQITAEQAATIYAENTELSITDTYIFDQWISSSSGGSTIILTGDSTATITSTHITGIMNYGEGVGGAIAIHAGSSAIIRSSVFTSSEGASKGGAIFNQGHLTVVDSSIQANIWYPGNTTQYGGGLYNDMGASATIINSDIGGGAVEAGGGIFNNTGANLNITNSIISGNTSQGLGEILYAAHGSTATLNHVTMTQFSAAAMNSGLFNQGQITLKNSLLDSKPGGEDCVNEGTLIALGKNLIEDGSCASIVPITGDPNLDYAYSQYHDPPYLYPLQSPSPAIDAGTDCDLTTDQRGMSRRRGASCDLGAYEYQYMLTPTLTTPLNLGQLEDGLLQFQWNSTPDALTYEMEIGRSLPAASVLPMGATTYIPSVGAFLPGEYDWRVRSVGEDGLRSGWSETRRLTVLSPKGIAPTRNQFTAGDVTLTWNDVTWATAWQVQISRKPTFTPADIIVDQIRPVETTSLITPLGEGGYHWRVRAQDSAGRWGTWSSPEPLLVISP